MTPAAPATEPPDEDGPSLVRLYVQEHEHRTGQALTSTHIGTLHSGEARP
jgi:hypothetical protein